MTPHGRTLYFTRAATIRQLLEILLDDKNVEIVLLLIPFVILR
jgi:hypothetical protein